MTTVDESFYVFQGVPGQPLTPWISRILENRVVLVDMESKIKCVLQEVKNG